MIERLRLGNRNRDIKTKTLFKNLKETCNRNEARIYYQEVNGKI